MIKNILKIAIALVLMLGAGFTASAQDLLQGAEKSLIIDRIAENNIEWESVLLTGKIRVPGLPLNPSVRIYMKKGESLMFSLRVPFFGEQARIELDRDNILAVNKHNKTYFKAPIGDILSDHPDALADVQSLLLGDVVVAGCGPVTKKCNKAISLYADSDDYFLLTPASQMSDRLNYGYVIGLDGLPELMVVTLGNAATLQVGYVYQDNGMVFNASMKAGKKEYEADLQLDEPDFCGKPFDKIKLDGKYKEVSVKQFFKSF